MNNTQARLTSCFLAVFPELAKDQILSASTNTVRSWDSVAGVTLLAVVEEEFGIQLDNSEAAGLSSFQDFLNYLNQNCNNGVYATAGDF